MILRLVLVVEELLRKRMILDEVDGLDRGEVLKIGMKLGLLGRERDVENEIEMELRVKRKRKLVKEDSIDRVVKIKMVEVKSEEVGSDDLGDVEGRKGKVEMEGLKRRKKEDEDLEIEIVGKRMGLVIELKVMGLKMWEMELKIIIVGLVGKKRIEMRKKEVEGIEVIEIEGVENMEEEENELKKNELNWSLI